jgi:hypothetical protein
MRNIDLRHIMEMPRMNKTAIANMARSLGVRVPVLERRLENLTVFGRESLSIEHVPGVAGIADIGLAPQPVLHVSEIPNYRKYSEFTATEAAAIIVSRYSTDTARENLRSFYIRNGIDANTFNRWLREISVHGTIYGTRVIPKRMRHYSASQILRHYRRHKKSEYQFVKYLNRNEIRRDEGLAMLLTGRILFANLEALASR